MKFLTGIVVFLIGSCSSGWAQNSLPDSLQLKIDTNAQYITLDTLKVTATAGKPTYRASATLQWKIHHTRAAIKFDFNNKSAAINEWITLSPYCYATDTVELDAKTIVFDSVALVAGKSVNTLKYSYKNDRLLIFLGKQYKHTDTLKLYLKYTSKPYDLPTGGSEAITEDRGLYFVNADNSIPNKPIQIWTQGETESNSHWLVTIDKPNTRFTTQIELTIPDSLVSLSNGNLIKQNKLANGLRTDIWRMDMPIQAYAIMFAVGKFSIIKDKWRNKEVSYYVEPQFAPYARLMFSNTTEMMEFFSNRTGVAYPWNKYSQVVVRDYVSGAMENTSASLFGEFMNMNSREIADKSQENVVAHELFHQWFGDYVTAESWSNLTLNESFANYGEQLWKSYKYGKPAADELAFNDLQGYLRTSVYNDPQLARYYYDDREDMFDAISYNKGGAILGYLHSLMGDYAFDKAMNIYLTKNALKSAEVHHWRMAVEEATGQDWNWFFNQWYYHGGHPILKIGYLYNDKLGKLSVIVAQENIDSNYLYHLPLKAGIINSNAIKAIDWTITKKRDTFTFEYINGERPVFVPDYTHVLPGIITDKKEPAQWHVQYLHCTDYISKRLAVSAAGRQIGDSSAQEVIEHAISDTFASIRRIALVQLEDLQTEAYRKRWSKKVVNCATTDKDASVRAEAFDVLGSWKDSTATEAVIIACFDSSYNVAASALLALDKLNSDSAYTITKRLTKTNPKSTLENAVYSILGKNGKDEDITFFEKQAPYIFNTKKYAISSGLIAYIKKVSSDSSFRKAADIMLTLAITEPMKNLRSILSDELVSVATELHNNLKADNKADVAVATTRLPYLKQTLEKIALAEKDPESAKKIKKSIGIISE